MKNNKTTVELRSLVSAFFKSNEKKTDLWFSTENPILGNVSPDDLISLGKAPKLLKIVKYLLGENER